VVERIRADTAAAPSTANATTNAGSGPLLHTNTLQIRTQLLDRACEALRECRFSIFMSAWQYSSLPPQCGSNGEDSTVYSPDEEEANNTGCANVIEEYRKHGELEDDQAQTCKDAVRMAQHRCAPDPSNDP
jgi:hypothetical protein